MRHFSRPPARQRRPTSAAAVAQKLGGRQNDEQQQRAEPRARGLTPSERYRVVRRIGQGAFGTAYLASDTAQRGKRVVVKKIRIDAPGPGGATAFDDFRKEVECLRQLNHHNIVGYIDSFFERPEATIVLECVLAAASIYKRAPCDRRLFEMWSCVCFESLVPVAYLSSLT